MADDLEAASDSLLSLLAERDPDHAFAIRLAHLAKEMRKDCFNVHFGTAE